MNIVFILWMSHEHAGQFKQLSGGVFRACIHDWETRVMPNGVTSENLWTAEHWNRNKHCSNELCDICFWGFALPFNLCWMLQRVDSVWCIVPTPVRRVLDSKCTFCHCLMLCFQEDGWHTRHSPRRSCQNHIYFVSNPQFHTRSATSSVHTKFCRLNKIINAAKRVSFDALRIKTYDYLFRIWMGMRYVTLVCE